MLINILHIMSIQYNFQHNDFSNNNNNNSFIINNITKDSNAFSKIEDKVDFSNSNLNLNKTSSMLLENSVCTQSMNNNSNCYFLNKKSNNNIPKTDPLTNNSLDINKYNIELNKNDLNFTYNSSFSNIKNNEDFNSRFRTLETLGSGTYGDVYKVVCRNSNNIRAVKRLRQKEVNYSSYRNKGLHIEDNNFNDNINNNKNNNNFKEYQGGVNPITLREIVILKSFNNKNIVKLVDVIREDKNIMLVFEYMNGGSLKSIVSFMKYNDLIKDSYNFMYYVIVKYRDAIISNYLSKCSDFICKFNQINDLTNEILCKFIVKHKKLYINKVYNFIIQYIFKQLIDGVKYIHNKNVIHRDIKPDNILLNINFNSLECLIYDKFGSLLFDDINEINEDSNVSLFSLNSDVNNTADLINDNINREDKLSINSSNQYNNNNITINNNINDNNNNNNKNRILQLLKKSYNNNLLKNKEIYSSPTNNHICLDKVLEVKIGDFGLARLANCSNKIPYTRNMVTLNYRSPELLIKTNEYGKEVDIWSLGCILAEIVLGFPIFIAENEIGQLNAIFMILGTPRNLFKNTKFVLNHYTKINFKYYIKKHNAYIEDSAIDLIEYMLKLDTNQRITSKLSSKHEFIKMKII